MDGPLQRVEPKNGRLLRDGDKVPQVPEGCVTPSLSLLFPFSQGPGCREGRRRSVEGQTGEKNRRQRKEKEEGRGVEAVTG